MSHLKINKSRKRRRAEGSRRSSLNASIESAGKPYVFVTVGTTKFDSLAATALDPGLASWLGVRRVLLQAGSSKLPAWAEAAAVAGTAAAPESESVTHGTPVMRDGVIYEIFRFAPDLGANMRGAAAIVSHAGAGCTFEALRTPPHRVRVALVVNPALQGNHQSELANALAARGHVLAVPTAASLLPALKKANWPTLLAPLPPVEASRAAFVAAVDAAMA